MFSTRETGMPCSRSAWASGSALLPTLISSSALPIQAAWMSERAILASARASSKASTIRSSGPLSQCSPKVVQPMPTMATLSLIPRAILWASKDRALRWRRLPKISAETPALVVGLHAQAHPHPVADGKATGVRVGEFHHDPCAIVELGKPEPERRIGREIEPVRRDRNNTRRIVRQTHILHRLRSGRVGAHGYAALRELDI